MSNTFDLDKEMDLIYSEMESRINEEIYDLDSAGVDYTYDWELL